MAVAVVDVPLQALFVLRFSPGGLQQMALLAVRSGVAFTHDELVATRLDRDVYLVSRLAVGAEPPPALEATWEVSTPAAPFEPAAGDLDGDGTVDVTGLLVGPPADGGTNPDTFVLLSLGRTLNGPLAHVSGVLGPLDLCNPQVWLQDWDGDGTDDLLVGERAPCSHPQRLRAYLMGPPSR